MLTERQRELRRAHLGASDTPQVLGYAPWGTALDVYWDKTEPIPDVSTPWMGMGHWLEIPLTQYVAEQLGCSVTRVNSFRVSSEEPILSCTVDAWIEGAPEHVECKYVGADHADEWGVEGTDQIPPYTMIQVQQQMFVAETERCFVAAAISRYRLERRLYTIERHDPLIKAIVSRAVPWWKDHIVAHKPPGLDTVPPLAVVQARQRTPDLMQPISPKLVKAFQEASIAKRVAERACDRAKAAVIDALGDAEIGHGGKAGGVTYREQASSPSTDFKRLRTDGLFEEYCKQGTQRTLRYTLPKGE